MKNVTLEDAVEILKSWRYLSLHDENAEMREYYGKKSIYAESFICELFGVSREDLYD